MSKPAPIAPAAGADLSGRSLPGLLLLFVGSGGAALIYEIVWFQMLQQVVGATAISIGVLLGTFMGGMCLGSLLLPRLISPRWHPLRVYATLEACIGALGVVVALGMPLVSSVYVASLSGAGHGLGAIVLRALVSVICLLPPTVLMGATLPAIARWLEATPRGVSWLGYFYGGNIAGAVAGSLLAGFYLLPEYDMLTASFVAAGINAVIALLGLGLAGLNPAPALDPSAGRAAAVPLAPGAGWVYGAIGLSGLGALGAEVVWTRLLSLILGGTVYAFSIILAVFLVGLGLGSSAGSYLARTLARPRLALGVCQLGLTAGIAWTAFMLADSLPYWPVSLGIYLGPHWDEYQRWYLFQLDLTRCAWAILPPTLLWGASFPLALAGIAQRGQDTGRLVGGVYAANTIGAIIGAVGFSVVAIPELGTENAQRLLIVLAAVAGFMMLVPALWPPAVKTARAGASAPGLGGLAGLLFWLAAAALLCWGVPEIPPGLIGFGRQLATYKPSDLPDFKYVGEGMNSSVAVSLRTDGYYQFHVSGKVEASTVPVDMRLQRMLGHLPALAMKAPQSVLIVGCGAGVTAGTFLTYPSIKRIVVCEIEPLIPQMVAQKYFGDVNYGLMQGVDQAQRRTINGKDVEVIYDDGRHFLLTTREHFDIITSDPIHPWVKGSASLYTAEYFSLAKAHLNPGGMVTQWVPLYESNFAAVQSELRTFFAVFPAGIVWGNDDSGKGYDSVVMGQADPAPIDLDAAQARLDRPDYAAAADSLSDVGFNSALDLFATFAGDGPDLAPWLARAEINYDRNLRLQYLAGLGLNNDQSDAIYQELKSYEQYPPGLFSGSPQTVDALRVLIENPQRPVDVNNLLPLTFAPSPPAQN